MAVVTLPNGMVVEAGNARELTFLYSDIFEDDTYLRHGIELSAGDCVFDVGANIGLFSAFLAERHRDLRLVLFEPIPETFALLARNAERLLGNARVTLVEAGVSSAEGATTFEFDPSWSLAAGASSHLRDLERSSSSARRSAGLVAWNLAVIADSERLGLIRATTARRLERTLKNRLLRPLAFAAAWALFALVRLKRRRTLRRIECKVTTVSRAMREYGIEHIDLLKIDAEGAEWQVLQGVDEADWLRIRQLVLEVHGREPMERIRALLEGLGFVVTVDRAEWQVPGLMGFGLLYAHR